MKLNRLTPEQKSEIISRRKNGESLNHIYTALRLSKDAVAYHLRRMKIPKLSEEERIKRIREGSKNGALMNAQIGKERREAQIKGSSHLWKLFGSNFERLSSSGKGKIAETAVLIRLLLLSFQVHVPIFDVPHDLLVTHGSRTTRLQIKLARGWRKIHRGGGQMVATTRGRTGLPYTNHDCEFIVGYSIFEDACYVVPISESGPRYISLASKYKEAWSQLF